MSGEWRYEGISEGAHASFHVQVLDKGVVQIAVADGEYCAVSDLDLEQARDLAANIGAAADCLSLLIRERAAAGSEKGETT